MNTKELRKMTNRSTLSIKYVDNDNNTSDGLYAIKKSSNRWIVGNSIMSNKEITSIYNKIEDKINQNWRREDFQYWMQ